MAHYCIADQQMNEKPEKTIEKQQNNLIHKLERKLAEELNSH